MQLSQAEIDRLKGLDARIRCKRPLGPADTSWMMQLIVRAVTEKRIAPRPSLDTDTTES